MRFFVHESIMYLQCGIANYVKMRKKTCILPLRYLNMHTVALLCTILPVVKYIYKIKKELCKSEQWKYLISKSALTLYEFEVKSLHSVRILHCFPCHIHNFLYISDLMLLFFSVVQELMFRSFVEYLKHHNICFFSIECRKQAKRGQNGCFSTLHTFFKHCMPTNHFQTLFSPNMLNHQYNCKLSQQYGHSLSYDKSIYVAF